MEGRLARSASICEGGGGGPSGAAGADARGRSDGAAPSVAAGARDAAGAGLFEEVGLGEGVGCEKPGGRMLSGLRCAATTLEVRTSAAPASNQPRVMRRLPAGLRAR